MLLKIGEIESALETDFSGSIEKYTKAIIDLCLEDREWLLVL
jgi:hypothetical protein